MRKNMWKRTAAVVLSALMAVSVIGCGGKSNNDTTTAGTTAGTTAATTKATTAATTEGTTEVKLEKDPSGIWNNDMGLEPVWDGGTPVTLSLCTSYSGELSADVSWVYDEFERLTGVKFVRTSATTEVINTMLASGDLTDLFGVTDATQVQSLAASGLMLNLDDYQDQLPNIYNNTLLESALQFMRDERSSGTGVVCQAPMNIGPNNSTCCASMIRYDLYKAIGSPKMETLEDFVEVLKQMRDYQPINENGDKVYVYCGWNDWGTSSLADDLRAVMGYETLAGTYTVYTTRDGSVVSDLRDKGSVLYRCVKAVNDLWNGGYIDPDTISQGYSVAKPKTDNGQGLFMGVEWMGGKYNDIHPGKTGFALVCADEFDIGINAPSAVCDGGIGIAASVAKDPAKLEAALRFLNWLYTPYSYDLQMNGPEGYLWEYNDEGKAVFTADGIQKYRIDREGIPGSTGAGQLFVGRNVINRGVWTYDTINPIHGEAMNHEKWTEFLKTDTRFDEWRADNGVITTYEWAAAQGDITQKTTAFGMMGVMPDDIQTLKNATTEAWHTYLWELMVCKPEKFDELWDEATEELKALGNDDLLKWCKDELATAMAKASKYPLKGVE